MNMKENVQKFLEKEGIAGKMSEFSKALGFYHQADVDPVTLTTYIESISVLSEIRPDFEKYIPVAKRYYNFVEPLGYPNGRKSVARPQAGA